MITPKGTLLCSALENTNLVSVEMTANWESTLKRYLKRVIEFDKTNLLIRLNSILNK